MTMKKSSFNTFLFRTVIIIAATLITKVRLTTQQNINIDELMKNNNINSNNIVNKLPLNIEVKENSIILFNQGEVISDSFKASDSENITLMISSNNSTIIIKPNITTESDIINLILLGELSNGGEVNNTKKELIISCNCLKEGSAILNLLLSTPTQDNIQVKIDKVCPYSLFYQINIILRYLYLGILLLILLTAASILFYFINGGTVEGFISILGSFCSKHQNKEEKPSIKYKEITTGESTLDSYRINSKRIRFNYEDYGTI